MDSSQQDQGCILALGARAQYPYEAAQESQYARQIRGLGNFLVQTGAQNHSNLVFQQHPLTPGNLRLKLGKIRHIQTVSHFDSLAAYRPPGNGELLPYHPPWRHELF
ncbi:hypothetical protein D3C87_1536250 [compost metagenome]